MTTLELYNGDCLEVMKSIPSASVDLIICDLPYGCLATGEGKEKINRADNPSKPNNRTTGLIVGCQWDVKIDLEKFWEQVKRIRKNDRTPCIHFCKTRFGVDLIVSNPTEFRYDIVWNKKRGVSFLSANKKPMSSHELIYFFGKLGATYYRIDEDAPKKPARKINYKTTCNLYPTEENLRLLKSDMPAGKKCSLSVIDIENKKERGNHPTAKPADLYKWLISRYSKEGDTILDPTFGSCNSGAVAMELNRNFIGIEMNEAFYDKAVERFNK